MFEKENEYFQKNKEELRSKYLGKHIVIVGDKIMGVYNSDNEALDEALKTMEAGTFTIKIVKATDEEEIQRFHSRKVCVL